MEGWDWEYIRDLAGIESSNAWQDYLFGFILCSEIGVGDAG